MGCRTGSVKPAQLRWVVGLPGMRHFRSFAGGPSMAIVRSGKGRRQCESMICEPAAGN